MKIIDIINQTATLLSLNDEIEILKNLTKENESETLKNEEIRRLMCFANLTLHELCVNYIPVVTSKEVDVNNKAYDIAKLTNFLRLQNVKKDNRIVNYKILNKQICFADNGKYVINYYTYPEVNSLFDELDFLSSLSPDVLVCGLASFYCLSKGLFDDFKIFNEKYKSGAEAIKSLKIFELPKRNWL